MSVSQEIERNPFTNKPYGANFFAQRQLWRRLPVSEQLPRLLAAIRQNQVVIVVGETGSGKTTQLPKQILLDLGMTKPGGQALAITQNRQLAASMVAERIAEEMDVNLGTYVGVKYKGRDEISEETCLSVVTDGTLVAAAKRDPLLSRYGVIVIDEAHQHTVPTDLLLGILKKVVTKRKDLKVVIMSATMDAVAFQEFYPGSVIENVSGREFKVQVSYLSILPVEPIAAIVQTILQVHLYGANGDILVFAAGMPDIHKIIQGVQAATTGDKKSFFPKDMGPLECYPLSAQTSSEVQAQAVRSVATAHVNGQKGRKVIVATNIAETSITLVGVAHVIDSCQVKSKIWNPREESWSLETTWISKATAIQRGGRAGRTKPGNNWRMVTQEAFYECLPAHSIPAILEGDMTGSCLDILKIGESPLDFPYMTPPATETVVKALELLHELSAIDGKGRITDFGIAVQSVPTDVYSAVALLASSESRCSGEVLSLVSMMNASEGGSRVFVPASTQAERSAIQEIRSTFRHPSGDHITLFNIYVSWRAACERGEADAFVSEKKLMRSVLVAADRTRLQLLKILKQRKDWKVYTQPENMSAYYTTIINVMASSNFLQVAKRQHRSQPKLYHTARHGIEVQLENTTDLGPASAENDWVIYNEFHNGKKKTIRLVSGIRVELLIRAAPEYWSDIDVVPEGHIRDSLVNALASMTGESDARIRGGMPKPAQSTAAPTAAP